MKGNSTCSIIYRCHECDKTVKKRLINITSVDKRTATYAKNSKIHDAVLQEKGNTFIFSDFGCTQDDSVEYKTGYMPDIYGKCLKSTCGSYEPNVCVVQKVCTLCMHENECE